MPALNPLLTLGVSTRAQANAFAPEFLVSTRSVRSTSDFLAWTLVITRELAAALESSERFIGVQIEIDKGDGVLVPLLQTEIEGTVNLKASRDGYGASTLSFAVKVPPSQSPMFSAWSRGPHAVKMTGWLGLPGAMQRRPMFAGYITQCTWEAYPSLLRIEAQDTSVLWASQKLAFNLEPGSLRTRKDVFLEVVALYNIPYGLLDFGPNDGGLLYKGISEGGTVDLLPWMVAFLTPIARRLHWRDGVCNVEPSYASGPLVRTYRANDIANLSIALPGTTDTNAVVMSSTVFAYIGPSGRRTEVVIKVERGVFAPATAVRRQDHTTGAISDLSVVIDPIEQEISRTVTTRVYDAGTIVTTSVAEWGWYTARACQNEQLTDGSTTFNHSFDVFFYADGSCRLESQQQYQLLRHTTSAKDFNGDGTLHSETVNALQFAANIVPLSYIDETGAEEHFPVFLTGDGVGWFAGCEFFDDGRAPRGANVYVQGVGSGTLIDSHRGRSSNGYGSATRKTVFSFDSQGVLISTLTSLASWGIFYAATEAPVVPTPAYKFGPSSAVVYASTALDIELHDIEPRRLVTYTPISETSHKETTSIIAVIPYVDLDPLRVGAAPAIGEATVAGTVPTIERSTSGQTAQPASVTVVDAVRSGLLGKVLPQYSQNDFCETVEELKTCALELLRDQVPMPEFDTLIDWTSVPGAAVALLLPDAVPSGERCTVWEIDWSFEGGMAANNQHIKARWLPQELR